VSDAKNIYVSLFLVVHPAEHYPIANEGDVSGHLNLSRLKVGGLCISTAFLALRQKNPQRNAAASSEMPMILFVA
jgi:hypothetical protein